MGANHPTFARKVIFVTAEVMLTVSLLASGVVWLRHGTFSTFPLRMCVLLMVLLFGGGYVQLSLRSPGWRALGLIAFYAVSLVLFDIWTFNAGLSLGWSGFLVLFVVFLHGGTALTRIFQVKTFRRLHIPTETDGPGFVSSYVFDRCADDISRELNQQVSAYYSLLPAGAIGILIAAFVTDSPAQSACIVAATILAVLCIALTSILLSLVLRLVSMIDVASNEQDSREHWADIACGLTDLRIVLFLNAGHITALLICSLSIAAYMAGLSLPLPVFSGTLIGAIFLFVQVPYTVGQSRMYDVVLQPYSGCDRQDKYKKLREEYAPLFPKFYLATSLATSGAGAVILYEACKAIGSHLGIRW